MARTQYRQPAAGAAYFLTYKRVKNINLRIGPDGEAHASAPCGVPPARVDAFVLSKAAWLEKAKAQAARRRAEEAAPCAVTPAQALALFEAVSGRVFPLFSGVLGGARPVLKVRRMKTRVRAGQTADHPEPAPCGKAHGRGGVCDGARIRAFCALRPFARLLGRGGAHPARL